MESHFVDNRWLAGSGDVFHSRDSADGSELISVRGATSEEIDAAVQSARSAFDTWRVIDLDQRAALLNRFADVVQQRSEELALLMADDLEVPVSALDVLDWLASTGLTLRPGEGDASVAYQFGVVPDPD